MSDAVITTIKWVVALIGLIIGILNAYFGGGWGRIGITWTFALSRRRKLRRLRARREWLQQLHDCNREYYGYLLSGVLWVLALLGLHLIMESAWILYPMVPLEQPGDQRELLMTARLGLGLGVFIIAVSRLSMYKFLLQNYDTAMGNLTRAIARMEAKQAGQQAAAAA
jgi:hypothetical protein